jgi:hypothetical protein
MTAIAFAAPVHADQVDPIPGTGVFVVGPDIAPGLYRTAGSASTFGVWINNMPTHDSICAWFTVGPMFANVTTTVRAFEPHNCQPWTRVP